MMAKRLDQATIAALAEAHIDFVGNFPGVDGNMMYVLKPDELQSFVDNPEAFVAKAEGGTVDELRRWFNQVGIAHCSARTVSGRQCRNHVSGGVLSFPEWRKLNNSYCAVHGGPLSDRK